MDAPAVAVSADGKKIATGWMDMRSGDRDVRWRMFDGGKAGPEAELSEISAGKQGHVSLAIDAEGVVYAAWSSGEQVVVCSSKQPKNQVVSTEERAGFPSTAVGSGHRVVVYEAGKGHKRVVVCRPLSD